MPRVAPPTDGDLPVFPPAQQYQGRTEINTRQQHPQRRTTSNSINSAQQHVRQNPISDAAYRQDGAHRQPLTSEAARVPPAVQHAQRMPSGGNRVLSHSSQRSTTASPVDPRPPPMNDIRYRPTRADTRSPPSGDLRRLELDSQPRRPIMGVQPPTGRNSPHDPYNSNFVGQPFGIVPEDTTRAPPYDPVLWKIFCQVDSDGSGAITQSELAHALINGDFTPFHVDTVALMIRLFDEDRNGTISFAEFEKLWKYLLEWRTLFSRFDIDHSGTISFPEFSDALAAFGYRLTTSFAQFLFRYHDKNRTKEMSFDLFVQSCVTLKLFTDVFKKFDSDMDGVITIGFEDFLKIMIKNR